MIKSGTYTAIGSWPHKDVDKITQLIIDNFQDIPVWPQLPNLSFYENMYVQYSEGLPCIIIDHKKEKIWFDTSNEENVMNQIQNVYENFLTQNYDYFKISEQYSNGLYKFSEKINANGNVPLIKGQTLGPVSLQLSLTDQNKRLIMYNDMMSDAIIKTCICKAMWQANFLKSIADKVILFIDEPYLVSFGSAYINITREQVIKMLNEVIDELHKIDVIAGVHCCGNTDWSLLMDTNIDIINFDAYEYADGMMLYKDKTNDFLNNGNYLAWGIVPTAEEKINAETPDSLYANLKSLHQKLADTGVDENNIQKNIIITPACGVGSISIDAAEKVINLLKGVSELYLNN